MFFEDDITFGGVSDRMSEEEGLFWGMLYNLVIMMGVVIILLGLPVLHAKRNCLRFARKLNCGAVGTSIKNVTVTEWKEIVHFIVGTTCKTFLKLF